MGKFSRLLCYISGQHALSMRVSVSVIEVHEPDEPPRKVILKASHLFCSRCDKVFDHTPLGIVYDPKFHTELPKEYEEIWRKGNV